MTGQQDNGEQGSGTHIDEAGCSRALCAVAGMASLCALLTATVNLEMHSELEQRAWLLKGRYPHTRKGVTQIRGKGGKAPREGRRPKGN